MSDLIPSAPAPGGTLLLYQTEDGRTRIQCRLENDTLWLTQAQIAELFQTTPQNVTLHLKAIFAERELPEAATCKDYLQVRSEGGREVTRKLRHYRLEAILAVGYRVRSQRGTQFRQWATARLSEYLVKGFTMDDERLKNPPGKGQKDYFDELLERIRDIRSSDRRFYQKVLDIYATSVDYTPDAEVSQQFFATVQNKMHWATHGQTAAEIIHERADAGQPFMGLLTTRPGGIVRREDVAIAKNYFTEAELQVLNRIVNLYLEYAELQALERKPMTMRDWITKLDEFLKASGRKLLDHAGEISAEAARQKPEMEHERYRTLLDSQPRAVDATFEKAVKELKKLARAQDEEKEVMSDMKTPRKILPLLLLLLLTRLPALHAADAPLSFADPKPQRYEFSARASVIDPRARPHPEIDFVFEKDGKPADVQHASVDTRFQPQGKLVIWLMGHSAPLFERVNTYGLHALRVHYANGWFGQFGNAAPPGDDKFLGKIRLEAATGEDFSDVVNIPIPDGMMGRTLQLVKWLAKENPPGRWEYFLTANGQGLRWDRVIISGSSHGATVSARFAKHQRVDRVVMFCGPRDQFETWQAQPSATPANRFFGFSHVLDAGWKGSHYCRSWELLGLQQFGPLVNVEQTAPPYGHTRRLISDADVKNDPRRAHGCVVPGGSAVQDAGGKFIHEQVWRYLFTHPEEVVGEPVPHDPACELELRPPAKGPAATKP